MNILNYLNVLDYDKDGVPDGCDECPKAYGNGKNGCTCNPAMAERYDLEAANMEYKAIGLEKGADVISDMSFIEGAAAVAFALLTGGGGLIIFGICVVTYAASKGMDKQADDYYNEARELREIASNYRLGCTE